MMRRALVSHVRLPEVDRDSGSQQTDMYVRWLLDAGWSVTFLASETDGEAHHARRLRQLGVPTFVGMDEAQELLVTQDFDLAVLAFWEPASRLLPLIRSAAPSTRVVVDCVDVHFLREARRAITAGTAFDEDFARRLAAELETYRQADAVITPSETEVALLQHFLGDDRLHALPLAKQVTRSSAGFDERGGMLFAGNFRHLPNGEAVEFLCRDVLPLLEPDLLGEHPLTVVGSRLDDKVRAHARGVPGVHMVGWVPSLRPYLEHARVSVAPLLHGAGIKGKVVESLMSGTPVVTTSIGAEGLGLVDGEHAVVADTAGELADGIRRLLTDRAHWSHVADAGAELAHAAHAPDLVARRFLAIVEEVLARPVFAPRGSGAARRTGRRERAYASMVTAVRDALAGLTAPGDEILVVSRGDDALTRVPGRTVRHFPHTSGGRWAGHHPSDDAEAIAALDALRDEGARYLALPSSSFWWMDHYRGLAEHLELHARRVSASEDLLLFDFEEAAGVPADYALSPLEQLPETAPDDAAWTLFVRDGLELPDGFAEELVALAAELAPLGVQRVQPTHAAGPDAGPPVTERMRGVLGREIAGAAPLPLLAVRAGAPVDGPVVLLDAGPALEADAIGRGADALTVPFGGDEDPMLFSDVRDVLVLRGGEARRAVRRSQRAGVPLISVVVATYARPDLLRLCLDGLCRQTLPAAEFEVVVVDDGSPDAATQAVLDEYASRLPLVTARIDRAGRSAAKNLAVLLARGELVLLFDDDDVPAPDLLEAHLRAHAAHPGEGTAILGHTAWGERLEITPLMHYLTDVDKLLFAYGNLEPGRRYDWRCFWEGRISCKRSLMVRHGLHDQRLDYSIDVELAWRLQPYGLEVVYVPDARSSMIRPIDFDGFCLRSEGKGRAQATIAALHGEPEVLEYVRVEGAEERWEAAQPGLEALIERIGELEAAVSGDDEHADLAPVLDELHAAYRQALRAHVDKGIAESGKRSAPPPRRRRRHPAVPPPSRRDEEPLLSVTMPIWNRTPELAEMAAETIERVWEVSRIPTEVVVVDNGSPVQRPIRARVHRFEENRGVATGWNTGIALCRAPVIAVLNSDCMVEPGWDEALYEAATTGRRIAFPYTDHVDGEGFRAPDQAGTAGWCFVLTRDLFDEVGPFDERFNPAYCEDTDFWHRAWELGIDLSPVPAARVVHARRTSASSHADWLLTSHRYLYGWKHGVEPMRAPPFYNREIVEYHCQGLTSLGTTT